MASIEPLGLSANQWQFLCDGGVQRYVNASGGKLLLESTRRQFLTARDILARLNGSQGEKERRGILLADDAGLARRLWPLWSRGLWRPRARRGAFESWPPTT